MKDRILKIIKNEEENDFVDYKLKLYSKEKKGDFIKDILAMANSMSQEDKFIIVGVEDMPGKKREIIGIDEVEDQEHYQSLIDQYIEPRLKIEYRIEEYDNKKIGAFIVSKENKDKPYMICKEFNNQKSTILREGDCFIRSNSKNCRANRRDFDNFYKLKRDLKVELVPSIINILPINSKNKLFNYTDTSLYVNILNYGGFDTILTNGYVCVYNKEKEFICKSFVCGYDKNFMGADFQLKVERKSAFSGSLLLNFTSQNCIDLDLDEYGEANCMYLCKLVLYDIEGNEYESSVIECGIRASGEILHKVWQIKGKPKKRIRLF